jgi:UDP-2,3-diacylglucosamine pyrophosphatase LpxH
MPTHDEILAALSAAFPRDGEQPVIRVLARCHHTGLDLSSGAAVFIPDLHLLAEGDRAHYPKFHFADAQGRDLVTALAALAPLCERKDDPLAIYQLGDLFDCWRTLTPGSDAERVAAIAASHAELVDGLRARGVRCLAGNHDYVCHTLEGYEWPRAYLSGRPKHGHTLVIHGDALDWAEQAAPDAWQEYAVQLATEHAAPGQSFPAIGAAVAGAWAAPRDGLRRVDHGDAAAARRRSDASGPGVVAYQEPGLLGALVDEVSFGFDLFGVAIEPSRQRYFEQACALAEAYAEQGRDVRCVVMGHTHGARLVIGRRKDGQPLVLLDVGAWFGTSQFGDSPAIYSAQLGVVVDSELRLYQIGARPVASTSASAT